ncbi:hypothetical protein [Microvirga sp. M2]|uniref:hypothetical protein n=1 Tax=Microvirga sp. M2 TaxID=3073270 RepID=UPI0039C01E7A
MSTPAKKEVPRVEHMHGRFDIGRKGLLAKPSLASAVDGVSVHTGKGTTFGIAPALSRQPDFIIRDEPVSAPDVAIRAKILNLLRRLQDEFGLIDLFIAPNLGGAQHIGGEVAEMYLGTIVEQADRVRLFSRLRRPCPHVSISAVPRIRGGRERVPLPYAQPVCRSRAQELRPKMGGRRAACHLIGDGGGAPHEKEPAALSI